MAYYLYIIIGILIIPAAIYGLVCQYKVSSTFNAYKSLTSQSGLSAKEVAEKMLASAGISDIKINKIKGDLTDNYDPRNKTLNLSESTHDSRSVAAIGVAAHEVGHAIQHHTSYKPLKIRNKFVPIVNFASKMFLPLFLIGIVLTAVSIASISAGKVLVWVSVALYAASTLFYLITVPVEFNASKRALQNLEKLGILNEEELPAADDVLKAAAQTYVSALVTSLLYFLRFFLYIFMLFGRNKD